MGKESCKICDEKIDFNNPEKGQIYIAEGSYLKEDGKLIVNKDSWLCIDDEGTKKSLMGIYENEADLRSKIRYLMSERG